VQRRGQFIAVATAALSVIASSGVVRAAAEPQNPKEPQIRIVLSPDMAQDIEHAVHQALDNDLVRQITREVGDSIDAVLAELPRLNRMDLGGLSGFGGIGAQMTVKSQDFKIEQTAHETKTIQIGATGAIDLHNASGDVSIVAGSGRDTTIDIVRKSRGKTEADAKLGLERVTAQVDARPDRVTIESRYPDNLHPVYSVSINYTITTPPGTRINVTNMSGSVTSKGIKGDQSVNVFSGSIDISGAGRILGAKTLSGDVTVTGADTDGAVEVSTISGDATVHQVKARQVNIGVTSGDVTARDVTGENVSLSSLSGSVDYAGALAKGMRLDVRCQSGDVKCTLSGSTGFTFTGSTFSGQVRVDPGFGMQTTNPSRRETRGTVGDGSAVVVLRGFSGDVVLTKK